MAVRIIVTIPAAPGKGAELAAAYGPRCAEVQQEPGCEQFEVFQGAGRPDVLVLLERWTTQHDLDVHAEVNKTRPPLRPELRAGTPTAERFTVD